MLFGLPLRRDNHAVDRNMFWQDSMLSSTQLSSLPYSCTKSISLHAINSNLCILSIVNARTMTSHGLKFRKVSRRAVPVHVEAHAELDFRRACYLYDTCVHACTSAADNGQVKLRSRTTAQKAHTHVYAYWHESRSRHITALARNRERLLRIIFSPFQR